MLRGRRRVHLVQCTRIGVSGIGRWSALTLWVTDDMRMSANLGVAELVGVGKMTEDRGADQFA